jgi:ADP-ribose pyrophosphatase YjhB (NUDIX family)
MFRLSRPYFRLPSLTSNLNFWYKSYTEAPPTKDILGFHLDKYGGVILDAKSEENHELNGKLSRTLSFLKTTGFKKGVWLELNTYQAVSVDFACNSLGFDFHHAKPGSLTLSKWIGDNESTLPNGATHQLGVGSVVIRRNDDNTSQSVLMVKEKTGPAAAMDIWKLPTGLVEQGEEIEDGAVREVFEETGITSKFNGILMIRHGHQGAPYLGEKSDMFIVCVLEYVNGEIHIDHKELRNAKWFNIQELQEVSKTFNKESSSAFVIDSVIDLLNKKDDEDMGLLKLYRKQSWREGIFHSIYK